MNKNCVIFACLVFYIILFVKLFHKESKISKRNPKFLFCIILTSPDNLKTDRPYVTLNTWASKCSNYRFVSVLPNQVQISLKKYNLTNSLQEPLNLLQPDNWSKENYDNLTRKVLYSFIEIYKEFKDYDWYLKADDDTFIHMDNFNDFFIDKNPRKPATYGCDFHGYVEKGYPSGGAGYVLSNKAFELLGKELVKNISFCEVDNGIEDVDVAVCLRKLKVYPADTIDDYGRPRFNPLNIKMHYFGNYPNWYKIRFPANLHGANCCSDSFISFHYMKSDDMIRLNTVVDRFDQLNKMGQVQRPSFNDIATSFLYLNYFEMMMNNKTK